MKQLIATIAIFCIHSLASSQSPDFIGGGVMANQSLYYNFYEGGTTDSDSNVILVGEFSTASDFDLTAGITFIFPPGGSGTDLFIQKLNPSGQLLWVQAIGGIDNEFSSSVHTNSNNEIIVTGRFEGTVDFDPGPGIFNLSTGSFFPDPFILKLDANGNFMWAKSLSGLSSNRIKAAKSTSNNEIILAGYYQETIDLDPGSGTQSSTSNGSSDNFVVKLDVNGNYLWSKAYGGTNQERIHTLALSQADEIFVAGEFQGLFVTSPSGALTLNSNGLTDCFIQKLSASGDHVWSESYGSSTEDRVTSLSMRGSSLAISGFFSSTTDFDPGPNSYPLTPIGSNDIYVLTMDDSGAIAWAKSIEYSDLGWWPTPSFTAMNESGEVYLSGPCVHNNVDMNPGPETFYIANNRPYSEPLTPPVEWINQFIIKLDANGDFLNASSINSQTNSQGSGEVASKGLVVADDRIIIFGNSQQNGAIDINLSPYLETEYSLGSFSVGESMLYASICSDFTDSIHYLNQDIDNIVGDTIHIHSIAAARQPSQTGGYTLDGAKMIDSRAKLLNPNNFGPSGIYPKEIVINDDFENTNDCISVGNLPVEDIFFFGGFDMEDSTINQFTQQEIDSLYEWSLRGGKMIHTSFGDSTYIFSVFPATTVVIDVNQNILAPTWNVSYVEDSISYILPTVEGMKTDLFRDGPFGSVNLAFQAGDMQGHFESLELDDKVYATDENGNPTLFMNCETLDLMIADVDVYSGVGNVSQGDSIYGATDRFWLNTIAFMDQLQQLPVLTASGGTLSLNDTYVAYEWYEDDELVSTDSNFSPNVGGNYEVIVTFNGGCQMTSNSVNIEDSVFASSPILEQLSNIQIYPNPSSDVFNVDFGEALKSPARLTVTDISGNELFSFEQTERELTLNMENFAKGVYFLNILIDKHAACKRIIRY